MPLSKRDQQRLLKWADTNLVKPDKSLERELDVTIKAPPKAKKRAMQWDEDEYDQPIAPPKRTRQTPLAASAQYKTTTARGRGGTVGRGRGWGRPSQCNACGACDQ